MRRRSPWTSCGSLLLAAVLFPASPAWTVYSYRSVAVDCQRAGEVVNCRAEEQVFGNLVRSADVNDIRIVRGRTSQDNGPSGVIAETEAGALAPLTSSTLGDDQIRAIADRIHQWQFTEPDSARLTFVQPPSLASAGLGAGIALLVALWGLVSLVGVARALLGRRPPPGAPQRISI